MKAVAVIFLATFLICSVSWAESDTQAIPEQAEQCQQLKDMGASGEVLAQRGCCSWHKGVCGCSGGRVTCCDGSFSPSCGCNADDPKPDVIM